MMRFIPVVLFSAFAVGCSWHRPAVVPTPVANSPRAPEAIPEPAALELALKLRSTERVAELKSRGGECAAYGSVLESSLQAGRVTVRDYMWRVEGRLVSGQARPDGAIVVARDIDPLNVGVRTIDDIVRTLEHEAAHVAFRITNGRDADDASTLVQTCSRGGP